MIDIQDLRTVLDNKVIHDNINLKIETGETRVVIGGSGVGKSVLIKVVNKLIEPENGKLFIDNKDILKLSEKEFSIIRKKMSVLFQGAALFDSLTVFENVAFPLYRLENIKKDEIEDMVYENLSMVGLNNIENKFPSELSGGMAKRVGLARAIITKPKYLFYDEPTTGLDPVMGGVINDLIIKLKEQLNVTSIVVTHDMNSAFTVGQKITMLYEGRVILDGTPEEIKNCDNIHVKNFINGDAEEIPEKLRLL